jgi:hypothetical protein
MKKNIGKNLREKRLGIRKSITMSEVNRVPTKTTQLDESYSSLAHNTLVLFNALPVDNQKKENPSKRLTKATVSRGFIFSPQVCANYPEGELEGMIDEISNEVGLEPEQMNKSFHKSWAKVRDAPIMQLVAEQAYHYMTTYGFERMGVYDESTVFIPNEQLNVPDLKDGIKLTVINGYTKKQLKEKVLKVLNSGMALKSVGEIVSVAKYVKLSDDEVIDINNREVRIMMFSQMDLIPEEPSDFLRMVLLETIAITEQLLIWLKSQKKI